MAQQISETSSFDDEIIDDLGLVAERLKIGELPLTRMARIVRELNEHPKRDFVAVGIAAGGLGVLAATADLAHRHH